MSKRDPVRLVSETTGVTRILLDRGRDGVSEMGP